MSLAIFFHSKAILHLVSSAALAVSTAWQARNSERSFDPRPAARELCEKEVFGVHLQPPEIVPGAGKRGGKRRARTCDDTPVPASLAPSLPSRAKRGKLILTVALSEEQPRRNEALWKRGDKKSTPPPPSPPIAAGVRKSRAFLRP